MKFKNIKIALAVTTFIFASTFMVGCKDKEVQLGTGKPELTEEESNDTPIQEEDTGLVNTKVQSTEKLLDGEIGQENQEQNGEGIEVTETPSEEVTNESETTTETQTVRSILQRQINAKDLHKFLKDNNLFIDYEQMGLDEGTKEYLEELRMKFVGKNINGWKAKTDKGTEVLISDYLDIDKNTLFIASRYNCPHCADFATEILEHEVVPSLFNVVYYQTESDVNEYNNFRKTNNLTFKLPTFFAMDDKAKLTELNVYDEAVPMGLLVTSNGYIYDVTTVGGGLFDIYPYLDRTLNIVE